jgi:hypothetical protein
MTLHAAWMEAVKRQTAAENDATEAAKAAQREKFESLLNRSPTLAEQSDQRLSAYAKTMADRQSVLMQAQGLAASSEEREREFRSQCAGRQHLGDGLLAFAKVCRESVVHVPARLQHPRGVHAN